MFPLRNESGGEPPHSRRCRAIESTANFAERMECGALAPLSNPQPLYERLLLQLCSSGAKKSSNCASPILFVADLLHPVNGFSVQLLMNGNMRQRRCRRSAVPVLFTRRNPNNIARMNLFNRSIPSLRAAAAGDHDQCLSQRMRMPRGSSARFKRDTRASHTCRIARLEEGIDPHCAREPVR